MPRAAAGRSLGVSETLQNLAIVLRETFGRASAVGERKPSVHRGGLNLIAVVVRPVGFRPDLER
jgi:hypothetical protein